MRRLSLSILMRSVELCRELRLETAARLFELGFRPRYMSQQFVQLPWTQYQQSEHKYEQNFRCETHDSLLGYALSPATTSAVLSGFSSSVFIAALKPRIPSPIPLPSSGSF